MSDRYVVAGNPVAHSRSPQIHAHFARRTGQEMEYRRLLVANGGFADAAREFFAGGGKGMNITLPFKVDAFEFAGSLTPRAQQAGAVNTLALLDDATLLGDNTDGAGLVRDLRHNLGWDIGGRRLLLLGAGGAARGVLGPLLAERPHSVVIANRSPDKARELALAFAGHGAVRGCAFADLDGEFDLLVNCTSASLAGEKLPLTGALIGRSSRCYDMVYAQRTTPFVEWALAAGAIATADGLGMLVEQAAESFLLWRGLRPETGAVIEELRAPVAIRQALGAAGLGCAVGLFREYQQWLGVDLCFQDFERELASLPGLYAPPAGALLLAERGGRALGCVAMRPVADGVCEMKRLYIAPDGRDAGIGRALAMAVIELARRAGYHLMRLDTLERLHEAMTLYASLGFKVRDPYYPNPLAGVVYWEKDLRNGKHDS